ncbi:MAG: hypothetical protein NTW45_09080 [Rhodocyclales bacterium]|nr:hypothetical protein [Rhodocyclales bacterium]
MKHLTRLMILLSLAAPLPAMAQNVDAGVAAIRQLGTLNGQALACAEKDAAARAKVLMLAHAPKTARFGAAYEEATQEAFLAQTKASGTCPDAKALAGKLDEVTQSLQATLPIEPPAAK